MKRILFSLAVVAAAGLTSCQKEADVMPAASHSTSAPQARVAAAVSADLPVFTTPHQLIKHGNMVLTYDAQKRLVKAADGYTEKTYIYGSGETLYTLRQGGKVRLIVRYFLNGQGRCTKLDMKEYTYDDKGNAYVRPSIYLAYYNADGRLSSLVRQTNDPKFNYTASYAFFYNADGELSVVKSYFSEVLVHQYTFSYDKPYSGAPQTDFYELNPNINFLPLDTYMRVFGSFRKHLIRSCTLESAGNPAQKEYYVYKLAADGYVTSMDVYDGNTKIFKKTIPFEFKTLLPGF
ncbi:hypothetical protein [Larkinella soli]|uniref:hypothetical protein n=1 Tax=Larkinella soli TaxID=1770527 RepID=UPI000FFC9865|nr:hypothetical protein [Larkinella soli]